MEVETLTTSHILPQLFNNRNLKTLLNQLNKNDFDWIIGEYLLKEDNNKNKEEKINLIVQNYPKFLKHFLGCLTIKQLTIILDCVKQNGIINYQGDVTEIIIPYYLGLIFPVEKETHYYLVVPEELRQELRQLNQDKMIQKSIQNSYLIQYLLGIVNLYGVLSIKQFINFYQEQNNTLLDLKHFYELINLYDTYDGYFHVIGHNEYIYHYRAEEFLYSLIQEIESKNEIAYYPFSKEEILKAGKKEYFNDNKEYQNLTNYIQKNLKNPHQLSKDLYYLAISGQNFQAAIGLIAPEEELGEITNLNTFIKLYIDFYNHIYQWPLKGNTLLINK